jgi:hypothetical protein
LFDKIRRLLGGAENATEQGTDSSPEVSGGNATSAPTVLTKDEAIEEFVRRMQQQKDEVVRQYQEELERFQRGAENAVLRGAENAVLRGAEGGTATPSLSSNVGGTPSVPPDASVGEAEAKLPEDPTVEDIVKYVTQQVSRQVRTELEKQLSTLRNVTGFSPAPFVVDKIVRNHPALQSVSSDAVKILEQLPIEYQNEAVADFVLWWLKGKRSEAEKAEAITELFGERSPSAQPVTLPYSSSDIERWAEDMGIDPQKLKQRLLSEMVRK